jgi:DNA-binding SARP family transcriptional activator
MLALEPNRVVSTDRLLDALWDDEPPASARGQIHICISAIRRSLAHFDLPELITTRPPGYLMNISEEDIDAQVFDQLVRKSRALANEGKRDEAVGALNSALDLWYGLAMDGLDTRVLRGSALQLEERRLAALETRIKLELGLGRHADIIGELTTLVLKHPLRETLRAHLMVALYRSGRQAEALEVYRSGRALLVEELGMEPGEELRRLESAILNGETDVGEVPAAAAEPVALTESPAVAPIVPRQLPAAIADFTGRAEQCSEIVAILTADRTGGQPDTVPIVAISGSGGVGKSSLVVHVAHAIRDNFPDGQLFADLRGGSEQHACPSEILERFLRGLGIDGTAIPDTLDERAEMYRSRLGDRSALITLDDAFSESQVIPLLPGSSSCAVLITSRTRLTGLPGAHRIDLGAMGPGQAVTLLTRILGEQRVRDEPDDAADLADLCGHLPLAVRIAGAKLASRPHWQLRRLADRLRDENRRLDELEYGDLGIRASIELSYRGLPARAQRLLRLLALLEAPDFPSWVAAPLLAESVADSEDLLEVLVDAHLVVARVADARDAPRYRFHHLIRMYARGRALAEEPVQKRNLGLRRALRAWLALAKEAHRREYGGDFLILHSREPPWHPPPDLLRRLSPHPMQWLEHERGALVASVRQAAQLGFDELCWDLALTAVTLFEANSYFDDWRYCTETALALVRRKSNSRGLAAMLYSLGSLCIFDLRPDAALESLEPALQLFTKQGDSLGRALVLRNLAFMDSLRGDLKESFGKYEDAIEVFKSVGDRIGEAHVLSNMARTLLDRGDYAEAEEHLITALDIARDAGSKRLEAQVRYRLGEAALLQGQLDSAGRAFAWVLRIVRDTGDRIGEAYALCGLGRVCAEEGQGEQAQLTFGQSLTLACQIGERLVEGRVRYELGKLDIASGRIPDGIKRFTEAMDIYRHLGLGPSQAMVLVALTEAHDATGSAESAEETARLAWNLLIGQDSIEARRLRDRLSLRVKSAYPATRDIDAGTLLSGPPPQWPG